MILLSLNLSYIYSPCSLIISKGRHCYMQYIHSIQLIVNSKKVMCHLSMKLFEVLDQTTPHTLDKIVAKIIPMKNNLKAGP